MFCKLSKDPADGDKKLSIDGQAIALGGQSVMEGMMLRGKHHWVLGVREPDGGINVEEFKLRSLLEKNPVFKLPFIRGSVVLVDSMIIGMRALIMSSQRAAGEEEKLSTRDIALSILFAAVVFVVVFKALPALFAVQLYGSIESSIVINFVEGVVKIGLFFLYIVAISRLNEVKRLFQYHGAEHKVIHSYEAGDPVGIEEAAEHTTIHVRCGTSFMLLVFIISVIVFTFMGRPPALERILLHVAIIPLVAGIAYEVIKMVGKHSKSFWMRAIVSPGLLMQRITTSEPDQDQIEVAIATLKHLLTVEGFEPVLSSEGSSKPSQSSAAEAPA